MRESFNLQNIFKIIKKISPIFGFILLFYLIYSIGIDKIIDTLNNFQPDYILSYPITFQQLAYFKKKGFADKLNPKIMLSSGYVLDEYTRSYVEDAFKSPLLNTYTAAESMSDIAFECPCKTWHINYDFYHVEAIDDENQIVGPEEQGHLVLTRLFGKGTPFIRYTGMDDWVKIIPDFECSCGLRTPVFKDGVEGRRSTSVILPDGRVFPSASFAILSVALNDLKTFKVTQFQIIQKNIDTIEILLVIDDKLRDIGPSVDSIFQKIAEVYQKKVGPGVTIKIKEVPNIKSPPGKPAPLVISNVKPEDVFEDST